MWAKSSILTCFFTKTNIFENILHILISTSFPSHCRVLLRQGFVHRTWAGWRWWREAVVQKEWPAYGARHQAGQHVGGNHAVHRKPRPGAHQRHAAAALPLLSVSHLSSLEARTKELHNVYQKAEGIWHRFCLILLPVWPGGSWGSIQAMQDAHQQKRNWSNIRSVKLFYI